MKSFKFNLLFIFLIIFIGVLFFAKSSLAATINSASCSQADVQAAINAAQDGDTVNIPSGICTWTSGITVNNKALDIVGVGIDATTINQNFNGALVTFTGSSAGGNVGKLSYLTISGSNGDTEGSIVVNSSYRFRIHHIKINDISTNRVFNITGSYGVLDHMTFLSTNGYNAIRVRAVPDSGIPSANWSSAMQWGTADAVYVEDSTFNTPSSTNCITGLGYLDAWNGARVVFRHNTVYNWGTATHGYDTAGESVLQWEIYNNDFYQSDRGLCGIDRYIWIRGGTGVVFNNTYTHHYQGWDSQFFVITNFRSCSSQQGSLCNGSAAVDENQPGLNGYKCKQQVGTGGPGPHTSVPIYEWNNIGYADAPSNLQILPQNGCANEILHIQSGRDFFNDTPRPNYTPYAYPHPLRNEAAPPPDIIPPAAPTGVTVS